jgi:pimeloyl-ACP methyl ester carboxylesterase
MPRRSVAADAAEALAAEGLAPSEPLAPSDELLPSDQPGPSDPPTDETMVGPAPEAAAFPVRYLTVHGHRRAYRMAGQGPVLLLLHGIGDSSDSWLPVMPALTERFTVIAPDLLGHGRSDKPRADYSVAAFANGMRDLLEILGVERATVVGHSLGGGVAAQFGYQYPERLERLVLVASGGIGPHVASVLRLASVPLAELVLPVLGLPPVRFVRSRALRLAAHVGSGLGHDITEVNRVLDGLPDHTAQVAFVRTLRSVVDWRGQVVTMRDRAYLADNVPVQIMWGTEDQVIPASHADLALGALADARVAIFEGVGHFPHRAEPERFVAELTAFIDETAPAVVDPTAWRRRLRARST